ncbi:MAG: P-loop NTPase [Anaerolineales bacterium]|jgi:CO dehydrogenase nickel-insertion accessory protein CooC1
MTVKDTRQSECILAGKRVGVFGKGGAGKSTTIVLLAMLLREHGYEVCVLDADSTNLGLPQALGIEHPPLPLMDYFGGMIFSGGLVTCPVDDPMPLPRCEVSLDDLPRKYYAQNQAGITLLTAGKIGEQGPGAGCDGPVSKIARDLKIKKDGESPVTLVDFKAGFEDTARGAITSLDWAIVLIDPTLAAVEMAVNMRDTIDQIKSGGLPATKHLENPILVAMANQMFSKARIKGALFVLNKIRDKEMARYLEEKLAERGIDPIGTIHEYPAISIAWLKGTPLAIPEVREEVHRIVKELEAIERTSPQPENV